MPKSNRKKRRSNRSKSGYFGVTKVPSGKYKAQISIGNKEDLASSHVPFNSPKDIEIQTLPGPFQSGMNSYEILVHPAMNGGDPKYSVTKTDAELCALHPTV